MKFEDTCSHLEALKRYLERNGLFLIGDTSDLYMECERCEMDIAVSDLLQNEEIDVEFEDEEEDD